MKVEIPKELKKAGRKFYVLRLHGDKITEIPVNEDGTFTTNKFSTYMLVYKDTNTENTTKPETKKDPKKNPKKNPSVHTGVKTSGAFFTGLMATSIAALGVAEVLKRRNK